MTEAQRLKGCIIGGAIGDAFGSAFENQTIEPDDIFYPFGKPEKPVPQWQLTDDTQLTLATCEAMLNHPTIDSEKVAHHFLKLYQKRKIVGIGASTLKAFRELAAGMHWSQVGRKGEYAAGNGAAMRIAPLAFLKDIKKETIRNICRITHHNEEAYVGAKCVIIAIQSILNGQWTGQENLLKIIIDQIPDTHVRDRLLFINDMPSFDLKEISKVGNSGYVVNSVPLAIAAASQVQTIGIEKMYETLIEIGGDTDTNCSMAGQIAGTFIGVENIPGHLVKKLESLKDYAWIQNTIEKMMVSSLFV